MREHDAFTRDDQSWKTIGRREQFPHLAESHWELYTTVSESLLEAFELCLQLPLEPSRDTFTLALVWLAEWAQNFKSIRRR